MVGACLAVKAAIKKLNFPGIHFSSLVHLLIPTVRAEAKVLAVLYKNTALFQKTSAIWFLNAVLALASPICFGAFIDSDGTNF